MNCSKLLTIIIALAAALAANAFTVGKLNYEIVDNSRKWVEITAPPSGSYSGIVSADLTPTVTHNGTTYQVAGIGQGAFANSVFTQILTLPEGLLYIDNAAFNKAEGLSVKLPVSLMLLSETAFAGNKFQIITALADNPYFATLSTTQQGASYMFLCNKEKTKIIAAPGAKPRSFSASGTTYVTSIVIPEQITEIGSYAFAQNPNITNVTFHSGITRVGNDAFFEGKLTSVKLLNPGTQYGDAVFCGNSNLTSVTLPDGIPEISRHMFFACSSLSSINLPASLKAIRIMGLSGTAITSVNLPDAMELLDTCALQNTDISSINLKNVKKLGTQALSQCTNLTSVTGNNKLEEMANAAFTRCDKLTKAYLPEGLKRMTGGSYFRCAGISDFTLPSTVELIERNPAVGCTAIKEFRVAPGNLRFTAIDRCIYETRDDKSPYRLVAAPGGSDTQVFNLAPGTEVVGEQALRESGITEFHAASGLRVIDTNGLSTCRQLSIVTLPATLETVGVSAFQSCEAITSITVKAKYPPACMSTFTDAVYGNATLYVPRGSAQAYRTSPGWSGFGKIVEIDIPDERVKGDINGDGIVDIADVSLLINEMLLSQGLDLDIADLNGDGIVDIADVSAAIDIVLGM